MYSGRVSCRKFCQGRGETLESVVLHETVGVVFKVAFFLEEDFVGKGCKVLFPIIFDSGENWYHQQSLTYHSGSQGWASTVSYSFVLG